MNTDSLSKLKGRSYPARIEFDPDDNLYVVDFTDLPGCSATGVTVEEAYARAQEAKADWLKLAAEQGLPIPEPSISTDYSGRVLLRLPSFLHASLAEQAKFQGTSLNQYLVHLLSGASVGDAVREGLAGLEGQLGAMRCQIAELKAEVARLALRITQKPTFATTTIMSTHALANVAAVPTESSQFFTAAVSGLLDLVGYADPISAAGQTIGTKSTPATTSKLHFGGRIK